MRYLKLFTIGLLWWFWPPFIVRRTEWQRYCRSKSSADADDLCREALRRFSDLELMGMYGPNYKEWMLEDES